MSDEQGFIGRWARRKAEVQRAAAPVTEPAPPAPAPVFEAAHEPSPEPTIGDGPAAARPPSQGAGSAPERAFDPASLPPVESLTASSDYRDFLRAEVPAQLRRQALRHLWRSDPVFANLDGLLEHGEDYSTLGMVETKVSSAWKLGRGFAEELLRPDSEAPAEAPLEPAPPLAVAAASDTPPALAGDDQRPMDQPDGAEEQRAGSAERGSG
ncbi:DUF3306 domain-containing protein [Geminicoccaceae bacterium 1502E]|nr:DUF3306 domain-containing protein [Geminicoccaceae bacterium 1502E]